MPTILIPKVLRSLIVLTVFSTSYLLNVHTISAQEHNSHEAEEHTSEEHEGAHQTDTAPLSLLS